MLTIGKLEIEEVRYGMMEDTTIGGARVPFLSVRTGPMLVRFRCMECGQRTRATIGYGLTLTIGYVMLECHGCGASETLRNCELAADLR